MGGGRQSDLSEKLSSGEAIDIKDLREWEQLHLIMIKSSSGDSSYLIENIDSFDKVEKGQILDSLVLHGHTEVVINNIALFPDTDPLSLARIFVKHNQSESVFTEDLFKEVDKEQLMQNLIDSDQVSLIFSHLDQFPNTDIIELSKEVIRMGKTGDLVHCFSQISKERHQEIIGLMVDSGYSTVFRTIIENCTEIDQSIAHKFILAGRSNLLLSHIGRFSITNPTSLIDAIIDNNPDNLFNGWQEFVKNQNLEIDSFMEKLIASGSCGLSNKTRV